MAFTDFTQALNQCEVLRKLWFMKLNVPASPITSREIRGAFARHRSGKQS